MKVARPRKATGSAQLKHIHPSKSGYWFWRVVCQGWSRGRCPHTLKRLLGSSGNRWKLVFPGILSSCDLAEAACGRQGPCASSEWERSDFYKAHIWFPVMPPCTRIGYVPSEDVFSSRALHAHPCTDVWDFRWFLVTSYVCTVFMVTTLVTGFGGRYTLPLDAYGLLPVWFADLYAYAYGHIWYKKSMPVCTCLACIY